MSSAREEVRRAVRAVEDADLPGLSWYAGSAGGRQRRVSRRGDRRLASPTCSTSPGAERAAAVAAEAAERERRLGSRGTPARRGRRGRRGTARLPGPARSARAAAHAPAATSNARSQYGTGAPSTRRLHARAGERDDRRPSGSAASARSACISRPAAPSALPTRRLARRNARSSIGPDGGTPTAQCADAARGSPAPSSASRPRPRRSCAARTCESVERRRVDTRPSRNAGVARTCRRYARLVSTPAMRVCASAAA